MAVTARHLAAQGRVQGVFFRASARDVARQHGVVGWVRNRADGAVEMHLQGSEDAVDAVEQWVRDGGPPDARVEQVEVEPAEPISSDTFQVTR